MRQVHRLFVGTALGVLATVAVAQVPAGYPATYADTIAGAKKEGKVVVYSTTDSAAAKFLIDDFKALYPGISVEYNDMNSTEVYNRFISEKAANAGSADVLWSSSMDLQIKLANEGGALTYASPEIPHLPSWAVWKNEAFGTTYEPLAIVYNKRLLSGDEIPQSHADLLRVFTTKADKLKGKVTTYDIEKSGVGFMLITQDSKYNPQFWDMVKALGAVGPRVQSSAGTMMERISSGENLLGFNIFNSYAALRAKKDPSIGIVLPKDYALVMSRVMFISKTAKNPNAGKLWLDYILSKRGQTIIANQSELGSIRSDVEGEMTVAGYTKQLGAAAKPIPVSADLLTYLDQTKRLDFIKQWQAAMKAGK
ncbi:MAG TPA: ABC transporter substrate-binding protein [Caldimonas sp.]|jgi:iron(III) transport system substrate-binding protein|nr:ABC transporter substrate-binding protein [Caldimonas sp.]